MARLILRSPTILHAVSWEMQRTVSMKCTEDFDNYELLMHLFEDWFCPKDQTNHFCSEFRERVQHPKEDATAFGHALKQLVPQAFPTFPDVEVERAIDEQFIDCLLDNQVSCHLRLQKPAKLERCYIVARDVERCYCQESRRTVSNL